MTKNNSQLTKGIVAGVLALAMLGGGVAIGYGAGTGWTYKKTSVDNTQVDSGNSADDLLNVTENKGIQLMSARIAAEDYEAYGIDAQAVAAYTITATVNSDAVDRSVIGNIAWKDSSSTWASGKSVNDYVTVNQDGLNFTFTIKQAFGEPVIFKVASCMNVNINATAQIDYLKELTSFTAVLNPSLSASAVGRVYVGETQNTVQITPVYGVGTIEGSISGYQTTFTTNTYHNRELKNALNVGWGTSGITVKPTIVANGQSFQLPLSYGTFLSGGGNTGGAESILNNFIYQHGCGDTAGSSSSTAGVSSIKYSITYSYGEDYSKTLTYTDSKGYGFRNDNLTAIATITNITLDKSNMVILPN